ncbi:MAG: M24 family metallopeptidase [Thermoplasmata archaeon]|nr:MAG: M24 family metallopeptidase [Thermoplasmata archaeon]
MELFEEIDAILIKNSSMPFIDENFFYFTGIEGMEESIAIITPDGIEIIAPLLEKRDGIIVYKSRKERDEILKKMLHGKKVGINGKAMVYEDYIHFKKMFDLVDVGKRLQMKRAIKSREEIKKIKKAVRITKEILKKIELEGRSERDVANEIKCMLAKKNAEEAFKTIVAFGKNSSMPHHMPSNKKFLFPALIDMGARYESYCADITRTFMKKKNKKYEIIEEALYLAIDSMEAGIKASQVYNKVEKFLDRHGIKMIHALGHSIGIKVHDGLAINKKANFEIKENMVFAIEPAAYFKKYGIRIEEDVLIKNGRARII